MTTGERIRAYRQMRQLTQEELGSKCGAYFPDGTYRTIAGSTIRRYENGSLHPKKETLGRIADALDIHWSELLDDSNIDWLEPLSPSLSTSKDDVLQLNDHQIWLYFRDLVQRYQECNEEKANDVATIMMDCLKGRKDLDVYLMYHRLTLDDNMRRIIVELLEHASTSNKKTKKPPQDPEDPETEG